MRAVVSLTTIPSRAGQLLPTLNSLFSQSLQPNHIYINYPSDYSVRQLTAPSEIPTEITQSSLVTINPCKDLGPITKLIPTLERETGPDTLIINCDDDILYPTNWLKTLVEQAPKYLDTAIGFRGRKLVRHGEETSYWKSRIISCHMVRNHYDIDILNGTWGALYWRHFFEGDFFDLDKCPSSYRHDDIWICGHLAGQGIKRKIIRFDEPIRHRDVSDEDPLYTSSQSDDYTEKLISYFDKEYGNKERPQAYDPIHRIRLGLYNMSHLRRPPKRAR